MGELRIERKDKLVVWLMAWWLVALAAPASSQDAKAAAAPSRSAILAAAREVMAGARFCTLVTLGLDGHPQARVVDPFAPEQDMTVWVATKPLSRKVAQLRKDPRTTLSCFDARKNAYVTLLGQARLVEEPEEKAKRWKEEWAAFYKDRNRGDDYLLIRLKPTHLEIVSYADGLVGDDQTWRPVELDID